VKKEHLEIMQVSFDKLRKYGKRRKRKLLKICTE